MLLKGPPRLDETGFERLLEGAARMPRGSIEGIDLREAEFADPFGTLGLLCIGSSSAFRGGQAWGLVLPESRRVMAFLRSSGALEPLAKRFVLDGHDEEPSGGGPAGEARDILLPVATVRDPSDVHRAVARVKGRTDRLLVSKLGYNSLAADRFTVAVAEICQNIVDHSGGEGFASARFYSPPGGRAMVRLAVSDGGSGVRASLAPRYAAGFPEKWGDREAVRLAFRRGVSASGEPGRGLGLKLVAEMVRGWGGRLLLRSGTAAFAIAPPWGPRPRRGGLAPFPGTQVNIFLPGLSP